MAIWDKSAEELRDKSSKAIADMMYHVRNNWFNNLLRPLGLTDDQIKTQNLEELKDSLERVNEALKNPDSFGKIGVKFDFNSGPIITKNKEDATVELGIFPVLLEKQKYIKEREKLLEKESKIEEIQTRIESVSEGEKENIQKVLETSKAEYKQLKQKVESEQFQPRLNPDEMKLRFFEGKAKVYKSFLEKESVATILGGFLLIVLAFALIIADASKITLSQVITDSFLLILGYFFGQSSTKSDK